MTHEVARATRPPVMARKLRVWYSGAICHPLVL